MKDLVILAADKDLEHTLLGLLSRPQALGIRSITRDIFIEAEHDPACLLRGVQFLSPFFDGYQHALLMFDYDGCGQEQNETADELETRLNNDFMKTAWGTRAQTIVLEPELESWVWSRSPHVAIVAGWENRTPSLQEWLRDNNWLADRQVKPQRPKEAFEAALRDAQKPRSASLYKQLAERVSLRGCTDRKFTRFLEIMQEWFPVV